MRYERLWFDSAGGEEPALRNPRADKILPSGEHVLSLGINWYINQVGEAAVPDDAGTAAGPGAQPGADGRGVLEFGLPVSGRYLRS